MGKRIFKSIKYILNALLSLIYDDGDQCRSCGELYDGDLILCNSCYSSIKFCEGHFNLKKENDNIKVLSSAYYNNIIKKLITNFKYGNSFSSGIILSKFMIRTYLEENLKIDFITFVPIKPNALKKRGFNQSEFLAKEIGRELDIPIISSLYIRKSLLEQKRLGQYDRWENLSEAFGVKCKENLQGKRVLLVDDVVTTGATVFNCAVTLKKYGVLDIIVLTAAKSCI